MIHPIFHPVILSTMETRNLVMGMLLASLLIARPLDAQPGTDVLELDIQASASAIDVCWSYLGRRMPCEGALDPIAMEQLKGDPTPLTPHPPLDSAFTHSVAAAFLGAVWGLGCLVRPEICKEQRRAVPSSATQGGDPPVGGWLPQPPSAESAPCFDIVTGDMQEIGPKDPGRRGNKQREVIDPLLQWIAGWNALGQPRIAGPRPTYNAAIASHYCRHDWVDLTLQGDQRYLVSISASTACVLTLYTYGDPADWESYVVVGRRELQMGGMADMSVQNVLPGQSLFMMVATVPGQGGRFEVQILPDQPIKVQLLADMKRAHPVLLTPRLSRSPLRRFSGHSALGER
jgi:hypothetical protein